LLLEDDISSTCKRLAMKGKLLEKIMIIIKKLVLTLNGAPSNPAQHSHTSHRG